MHEAAYSELAALEGAHERVLADARVILAAVVFCTVLFVPEGLDRLRVSGLLLGYLAYGLLVRQRVLGGKAGHWSNIAPWVDVTFYSLLVASSGGRFVLFLLYPVAAVSFKAGPRRGLQMAFACAFLLMGIEAVQAGFAFGMPGHPLSAGTLVILLGVAIMIARWAQAEATLTRRLAFASDLNRFFSPNNSLDAAARSLAWTLRMDQRADSCLLLVSDAAGHTRLYLADLQDEKPASVERVDPELVRPLLALPQNAASFFCRSRLPWRAPVCWSCDLETLRVGPADAAALTAAANLLETRCFVSLPVRSRDQVVGRCFLASSKLRYARHDVRFVSQVIGQAGVMFENMRLLDRQRIEAAREERRRISLDLHDGTIQPYIGLKLGLEALRRRIPAQDGISREIEELIRMAGEGINQLRRYVGELKTSTPEKSRAYLLAGVRLQAEKFSRYFGIETSVSADQDIAVEAPLYDVVIHIVREALSNVRRHTSASRVEIQLEADAGRLALVFRNDGCVPNQAADFCPRSIAERTRELGGRLEVERRDDGHTVVRVEVPI